MNPDIFDRIVLKWRFPIDTWFILLAAIIIIYHVTKTKCPFTRDKPSRRHSQGTSTPKGVGSEFPVAVPERDQSQTAFSKRVKSLLRKAFLFHILAIYTLMLMVTLTCCLQDFSFPFKVHRVFSLVSVHLYICFPTAVVKKISCEEVQEKVGDVSNQYRTFTPTLRVDFLVERLSH